ncbi:MAG TPA: ABC transporter permease subunit [Planctomycetota bacterium]|nr:ABC transporter permease subunit [Planctomycetota bacterium]
MPGLATSTWLLFRTQLSRVWWSRRAHACLALAAATPVIAWLAAAFGENSGAVIATTLGWMLLLQVIVPLLALVAGSAVITEEIEDRTISYLFSRPIPRASVLLGRWLAALLFVSTLLAVASLATVFLASRSAAPGPAVGSGIAIPLLEAAVLGGAVYSAIFAAAGVFFRHPMIVGLGYAFAIEGFLANLPGRNQALTVQFYLRSFVGTTGSETWREVEGFGPSRFDSAASAVVTLAVVLVLFLAAASWRITRREFVLSA